MIEKLKIISDGTPMGTFVEFKGERLRCVSAIDIQKITNNGLITANIEFCDVALSINADIGGVQCTNVISDEAIKKALGMKG